MFCKITAGVGEGKIRENRVRISIRPGKGKAVPLQAWSDTEGSRNLMFPDFMTTAQDGGKVVSLTHRPLLLPGNTPGIHLYKNIGLVNQK